MTGHATPLCPNCLEVCAETRTPIPVFAPMHECQNLEECQCSGRHYTRVPATTFPEEREEANAEAWSPQAIDALAERVARHLPRTGSGPIGSWEPEDDAPQVPVDKG